MEVFGPLREIKSELVPHVCWEGDEVVHVVGGEDASEVSVGADVDGADLVAAINQISARQNIRFLQNLIEIKHHHTPAIVFELEGNLGDEAVLRIEVLKQITDRDTNPMRSLRHPQVDVIAERQSVARAFYLEVDVSACQAEGLDIARRVRQLNVVVR